MRNLDKKVVKDIFAGMIFMIKIEMDMPKNCSECRFYHDEEGFSYCSAIIGNDNIDNPSIKDEKCPLKEE